MRDRRILLALVAGLVLAGCSVWTQGRAAGGRAGNNPFESSITAANVGGLAEVGQIDSQDPVNMVVNGSRILAFANAGAHFQVRAYDLAACGPTSCTRTFTGTNPTYNPAFVGDTLFALVTNHFDESPPPDLQVIGAFDDHGPDSCRDQPFLCPPKWIAVLPTSGWNGYPEVEDFVIDGNSLIGHIGVGDFTDQRQKHFVAAWDIADGSGCAEAFSGVHECQPRWVQYVGSSNDMYTAPFASPPVSVDGHVVSALAQTPNGVVQVRDRDGNLVWSADAPFTGDPIATATRTWVPLGSGVAAFDTKGVDGCSTVPAGTPAACSPLWSATVPTPVAGTAVTNDFLYVTTTDGRLFAYDAHGATGCTGTPRSCAPLWSATVDNGPVTAPTVAGDVVYAASARGFGSTSGVVRAFDAAGDSACSGAPKVCAPLRTVNLTTGISGPLVVAAGAVLVPTYGRVEILKVTA